MVLGRDRSPARDKIINQLNFKIMAKEKKGFIVKFWMANSMMLSHLLPHEIHLIKTILKDSDSGRCEVMQTTYTSMNDFITQKF